MFLIVKNRFIWKDPSCYWVEIKCRSMGFMHRVVEEKKEIFILHLYTSALTELLSYQVMTRSPLSMFTARGYKLPGCAVDPLFTCQSLPLFAPFTNNILAKIYVESVAVYKSLEFFCYFIQCDWYLITKTETENECKVIACIIKTHVLELHHVDWT